MKDSSLTSFINMDRKNLTEREVNMYSPLSLAFLGDSVYDTLVRELLLRNANMSVAKLHSAKIRLVCAEFQSRAYDTIMPVLDEKEVSVLKRGRNANGNNIPKHAEAAEYHRATAVECLFGYLYLLERTDRIAELFDLIMKSADIE